MSFGGMRHLTLDNVVDTLVEVILHPSYFIPLPGFMLAAKDLQPSSHMPIPPQRHIQVVWFGPLPFLSFVVECHLEALIT
jgi:hypothetical protein